MDSIDKLENMDLLDLFFKVRQAVYDYFGFVEDYVVYPIEDYREYYWRIADNGEVVIFGEKNDEITELIKPTVDIISILKPIYNFKAKE